MKALFVCLEDIQFSRSMRLFCWFKEQTKPWWSSPMNIHRKSTAFGEKELLSKESKFQQHRSCMAVIVWWREGAGIQPWCSEGTVELKGGISYSQHITFIIIIIIIIWQDHEPEEEEQGIFAHVREKYKCLLWQKNSHIPQVQFTRSELLQSWDCIYIVKVWTPKSTGCNGQEGGRGLMLGE